MSPHLIDINGIVFRFSPRVSVKPSDGYMTIFEAERTHQTTDQQGIPIGPRTTLAAKSIEIYINEKNIAELEEWIAGIRLANALVK